MARFLQAGCPSCCSTNSVKALKASTARHSRNISSRHHHGCLIYCTCQGPSSRCATVSTGEVSMQLRATGSIVQKHDVIHKPEIDNVSQRHQRRTEPRPQTTCTKTWLKFGHVWCLPADRQIIIPRTPHMGKILLQAFHGPWTVSRTTRLSRHQRRKTGR